MDGYVRVSRRMGREGPAYISPKVQQESIERWAQFRGVEITAWHIDEDQSGGTQNRPGLREAIRRIEAGETEGIACWRLNRFARNVSAAIDDVKKIQALGGHLAFVEEDIDPTGPFGSFLLTVLLAVATLERDNLSSGWLAAKTRAIERGVRIGPPLPGYKRGDNDVLELNEPQAVIMRQAFRLAATSGIPATVDYLKGEMPDRVWTSTTTRRLLGSRIYLGEVAYGDLVNPTAHPPLVSRGEWEAAQVPAGITKRRPSASYPLTDLAVCAECGETLVGSRSNETRVYRCKNGYRQGNNKTCKAPAVITAERLETYVTAQLKRALIGHGVSLTQAPSEDGDGSETSLEDAEAELFAFAEDQDLRKALGSRYQELLDARIDAVEKARDSFREEARDTALKTMAMPAELIDEASPEELRNLFKAAFKRIAVKRGRGTVEARVELVERD